MQEEVTQRTVALCVEATKLSAGMLQQAMKKVLDEMQKGVTGHKTKLHHGKQTLRQLMKHNTGVSNIEITDQNIKAFSATAKKYYTRFNIDHPADFKGHSLSVSDVVVLHQDGKDTAHYCDRAGFSEVPEFLQPAQKSREITERIQTPRGSFYLCGMTREQMEADGYGFHHASEDGKYLIMANGTQAYAVRADAPEKDNPLRTAEMTLEDDYGMIDGVINNGRRGEELEKAREHAERTQPEKKPSIRERLAAAKQECAKQQPRPAPEKKPPELGER